MLFIQRHRLKHVGSVSDICAECCVSWCLTKACAGLISGQLWPVCEDQGGAGRESDEALQLGAGPDYTYEGEQAQFTVQPAEKPLSPFLACLVCTLGLVPSRGLRPALGLSAGCPTTHCMPSRPLGQLAQLFRQGTCKALPPNFHYKLPHCNTNVFFA